MRLRCPYCRGYLSILGIDHAGRPDGRGGSETWTYCMRCDIAIERQTETQKEQPNDRSN